MQLMTASSTKHLQPDVRTMKNEGVWKGRCRITISAIQSECAKMVPYLCLEEKEVRWCRMLMNNHLQSQCEMSLPLVAGCLSSHAQWRGVKDASYLEQFGKPLE